MKSKIILLVALFVTTMGYSQRNPNQSYLTSFVYEAKQGMTEKFESAAAKKTKMFNSEEGNTIWTYRVTSGPSQGQYVRFLINQSSEDYGQDSSEELAYWEKNVSPYANVVSGAQHWSLIEGLNVGEDSPAAKYLERSTVVVKPGQQSHVRKYLYRQGVIMDKAYEGSALRRVFSLTSGGNTQTMAVFRAFNEFPHWSDSSNQSWEEMYNDEFGWNQLEIDSEAFDNAILEWSPNTILMQRVDNMMPN
jgi:hypothetical protein|tara:strand:- start:31 stop:774 length:744 start_codon:yes stop_codon:yes gene_type:complete